jgi:hypothetical protein
MAIESKYSDSKFPKALLEKVAKCFSIIRHGKSIHCIFVDDMQLKQPHVRLKALREKLCEHYTKQGWSFNFDDEFTLKDAISILRQAILVYELRLHKSQTTTYGIPRKYYSILREDQPTQPSVPRTISVERKAYIVSFC